MTPDETPIDPRIHRALEAVWRMESARIIATLARMMGDIGIAEDLAQDAMLIALQRWPETGVPDNAGAWLMATAKHRAIDALRRDRMIDQKHSSIAGASSEAGEDVEDRLFDTMEDEIGDDLLRLIFTACHPVLSMEARVALTLRMVGGLTTDEIARAFVIPEATVAQRIVRAKRTLTDAGVPFEVPRGAEFIERLSAVLQVIYLIFNEGYSATSGDDLMRPALCDDALRLGRILAGLAPREPEVHGLVALMELQASRTHTRIDANGDPVLLLDQNRARWDRLLIARGFAALEIAQSLGGLDRPYTLQAAIAACHAHALTAEQTNWSMIADLYGRLVAIMPSPVVELNRAVAVGMAEGPDRALEIVDDIERSGALAKYHLLPAVRADFLKKLGRTEEARTEFLRAASLTRNEREKALLLARAEQS